MLHGYPDARRLKGLHLQVHVLDSEWEAIRDAQARAFSSRFEAGGIRDRLCVRSALISPLSGCLSTCLSRKTSVFMAWF